MAVLNWEDLTTVELGRLADADPTAILPVAAVEQHGPHLPLGTDAMIVDGIVGAALARPLAPPPVLRLPTQRVGLSPEHITFPGTLTLAAETVLALWTAIGTSVRRSGIHRLVIVNSHGGQGSLVDIVAQRLRNDAGMLVARCSTYRFAPPDDLAIPGRERRYGLHGGLIETSLMLAVAPHLVRTGLLVDFPSRAEILENAHAGLEIEGEAGLAWQAQDLNTAGVVGNAAAATAELGRKLLAHYADRVAAMIRAVQMLPLPGDPDPADNESGHAGE